MLSYIYIHTYIHTYIQLYIDIIDSCVYPDQRMCKACSRPRIGSLSEWRNLGAFVDPTIHGNCVVDMGVS